MISAYNNVTTKTNITYWHKILLFAMNIKINTKIIVNIITLQNHK